MMRYGLFFLLFVLVACTKNEPPVPAYIYVPNIQFQVSSPNQGSNSSNIKDAWISVDGQLIGTNNLPTILPVIVDGPGDYTVRIGAGIENNGVANLRSIYAFYTRHEQRIYLEPGKVDTIAAQVGYDPQANIIIVEDFEGPGVVFGQDLDNDSATYMIKTQEQQRDGAYVGKMVLPDLQCVVATTARFSNLQPPGTSFPVYLELDYKTNTQFEIGVISYFNNGQTAITYICGVNPKENWNKLYIDLRGEIFRQNAAQYGIVFRALKRTQEPVNIYFDNVKLLHY